jgi:hypothetical protein
MNGLLLNNDDGDDGGGGGDGDDETGLPLLSREDDEDDQKPVGINYTGAASPIAQARGIKRPRSDSGPPVDSHRRRVGPPPPSPPPPAFTRESDPMIKLEEDQDFTDCKVS